MPRRSLEISLFKKSPESNAEDSLFSADELKWYYAKTQKYKEGVTSLRLGRRARYICMGALCVAGYTRRSAIIISKKKHSACCISLPPLASLPNGPDEASYFSTKHGAPLVRALLFCAAGLAAQPPAYTTSH